jgi:predicted PolB exonuclease-like 3'-5' exonuclease
MIHVVFNEPDVEVIKKAIELDPSLEGEVMLSIHQRALQKEKTGGE